MKKNIITTVLAGSLLIASYSTLAQDLSAIKREIRNDNDLYFELFRESNLDIVNLYTDDAHLLSPNAPAVKGRAALIADFSTAFKDVNIKGVKFFTQNIYGSGPLFVTEEGTWQVFKKDGSIIDSGKYLKLWKKTAKGWKIFRDIFNSDNKS